MNKIQSANKRPCQFHKGQKVILKNKLSDVYIVGDYEWAPIAKEYAVKVYSNVAKAQHWWFDESSLKPAHGYSASIERVAKNYLKQAGKYPPRAADYNKVTDSADFWTLSVRDAERLFNIRLAPKEIGDLIFFLNMAASEWENMKKIEKQNRRIPDAFEIT